jgi:hypothetical protein
MPAQGLDSYPSANPGAPRLIYGALTLDFQGSNGGRER